MSNIRCPGGHAFSDGEIPSPVLFRLIPDAGVEGLVSHIVELARSGDDVEARVTHAVLSAGFAAYVCPECGRLLVFRHGDRADSYRPE